MDASIDLPIGVLVASLGGMAIGLERQWSGHASGPRARFGGIRTFTLLGAMAGVSGTLAAWNRTGLAVVLLAAAAALVVMAYVAASRTDVDATTEASALVVLAAGVLAGLGYVRIGSAIVAVTTLLLVEKSRLHDLAARIDDESLRAALRFGVMAIVVLPLLPEGPFGPGNSVRPRALWMLVLLCSGISFTAYLARRLAGGAHGYPVAGLLGGLVSSTSVTLTFARASRQKAMLARSLALGVVAACTVLFARVGVTVLILNRALAWELAWYLAAPFVLGVLFVAFRVRALSAEAGVLDPPRNPLDFWPALQMAAIFQVVLIGVQLIDRLWGSPGVIASGAVLGLTDVDALTIAMARRAAEGMAVETAARAVAVGILANTSLKLAVVLAVGVARFKTRTAPALAVMAVAIVAALAWRS